MYVNYYLMVFLFTDVLIFSLLEDIASSPSPHIYIISWIYLHMDAHSLAASPRCPDIHTTVYRTRYLDHAVPTGPESLSLACLVDETLSR
jgi:hypothetical protein